MNYHWANPQLLWLGPALGVVVLVIAVVYQRWQARVWRILGLEADGGNLSNRTLGVARHYTRSVLLALAITAIGLALANFELGGQPQLVERQGADVVFALDVSRSMNVEDAKPSRLEKSKFLIGKTIEQLGGDRVGLIVYAGSAYPALPITTDYAAAKTALGFANSESVPNQGTNLGAALEYAVDYFDPGSAAGRYIVVLTDGEDHEQQFGSSLEANGIEALVVGIGTEKGGPIVERKTRNGTSYKKDRNGEIVISKRDAKGLQEIAHAIGAKYVDGNQTDPALNSILSFIEGADKAAIEEELFISFDSQFQWFVGAGLFFLLLYLLLPAKTARGRWTLALILALGLPTSSWAQTSVADTLPPYTVESEAQYNRVLRQGARAANDSNYIDAARAFAGASLYKPDAFEPQYNLGTTLLKAGAHEASKPLFQTALSNAHLPEQKAKALHNLGNAHMAAQEYEQAAKSYIDALKTGAADSKTRYNLNQALKQLAQQEQQQEQEQDQEQEDTEEQEKEDKEQDGGQNEEQNEEQSEQEQQDQQDQQQNGEGDNKDGENSNGEEGQEEKNKAAEGGEEEIKMNAQEIQGLLEAIQRAEQKTAEKVNAKKTKGKTTNGEKDW